MQLNKKFFDKVRASLFGGSLTQEQVDNLNHIFDAWKEIDGRSIDLLSYSLATTFHEVGRNLRPISENLNYNAERIREVWPSRFATLAAAKPYARNPQKLANKVYGGRLGNDTGNDGYLYRGRGYSQITGKFNYIKFSDLLKIDLVKNPDLAMQPKIAAKILILGIRDGLFTGKKITDYSFFEQMRPIINADSSRKTQGGKSTVAKDVASYANKFKEALIGGIDETKTEPKTKNLVSDIIRRIIDAIVNAIKQRG